MTAGEAEASVYSSEAVSQAESPSMRGSKPDIGKGVDTGEAKPL